MGIFDRFRGSKQAVTAAQPAPVVQAVSAAQPPSATQPQSTDPDSSSAKDLSNQQANPDTASPEQDKMAADYEKLMELEKRVGAPNSGGIDPRMISNTQHDTQEKLALKVRNPFRGA